MHSDCRPCCPAFDGTFRASHGCAVREKRCGGVGVDRFAATEAASIVAQSSSMLTYSARVHVVVDGVGVPVLRPTAVFTERFKIGPSTAALNSLSYATDPRSAPHRPHAQNWRGDAQSGRGDAQSGRGSPIARLRPCRGPRKPRMGLNQRREGLTCLTQLTQRRNGPALRRSSCTPRIGLNFHSN